MIASTPTGSDRHPGRVIQVNPTHEMEIVDQMTRSSPLVAVGLSGAGWHPAAWREPSARPKDLLTAGYWRDVIGTAAAAAPVLVTIDDGFGTHPGTVADPDDAHAHTDRVAGRLDSVLIAARVAPQVGGIGILPTVVATHTEPFHAAKAIATLDFVSRGRAAALVAVDASADGVRLVGRRSPDDLTTESLYAEAGEYAEVLRRLWDSWEDDAEIRDVDTGRFVDRDKLHHIDFHGRFFSVRGPSITPRPPQGRPVIAGSVDLEGPGAGPDLEHDATDFLARSADLAFLSASDATSITAASTALRIAEQAPLVFADVVVHLDRTATQAHDRRQRLDELAGVDLGFGTQVFAGTPTELGELIGELTASGTGIDGVRLLPAAIPDDLGHLAEALSALTVVAPRGDLRTRLGLPTAVNRYVAHHDSVPAEAVPS